MSNAKIRFEVRLAEGFKSIWGIFDHKHNRFVKKEDGFNVACRTAKEETGARIAESLNAIHEAEEKLRRDQEFEASAPKKTVAKKPATKKTTPKAAPKAETKPAPMKRSPPKVVKAQPKVEPKPAPVAETKTRRKKAA